MTQVRAQPKGERDETRLRHQPLDQTEQYLPPLSVSTGKSACVSTEIMWILGFRRESLYPRKGAVSTGINPIVVLVGIPVLTERVLPSVSTDFNWKRWPRRTWGSDGIGAVSTGIKGIP